MRPSNHSRGIKRWINDKILPWKRGFGRGPAAILWLSSLSLLVDTTRIATSLLRKNRKSSNIDPHSFYLFLCLFFADQLSLTQSQSLPPLMGLPTQRRLQTHSANGIVPLRLMPSSSLRWWNFPHSETSGKSTPLLGYSESEVCRYRW